MACDWEVNKLLAHSLSWSFLALCQFVRRMLSNINAQSKIQGNGKLLLAMGRTFAKASFCASKDEVRQKQTESKLSTFWSIPERKRNSLFSKFSLDLVERIHWRPVADFKLSQHYRRLKRLKAYCPFRNLKNIFKKNEKSERWMFG